MLSFAQSLVGHALGSGRCNERKMARGHDRRKVDYFATLPDDLLSSIIGHLDVKSLLSLQQCDRRLRKLARIHDHLCPVPPCLVSHGISQGSETVWFAIFMGRFGIPSKNQEMAHKLAGAWQVLYKSKIVTNEAAGQWRKPCPYELQAALRTMVIGKNKTVAAPTSAAAGSSAVHGAFAGGPDTPKSSGDPGTGSNSGSEATDALLGSTAEGSLNMGEFTGDTLLHEPSSSSSSSSMDSAGMNNEGIGEARKTQLAVIFLLDSSGSVGEEDFTCMTEFLDTAAHAVATIDNCKVGVVQFSNDTRVEVPLGRLDRPAFDAAVKAMVRLNGGTNIASAVAKAGALLKADEAGCCSDTRRVLVLLTDGRIDSYQSREAASMVARLSDEQPNVTLWAFGVGRGVDSAELMRIIEGTGEAGKGLGQEQYMDLCVRDDAPW